MMLLWWPNLNPLEKHFEKLTLIFIINACG
uniref:Uncharacterized protein n=1 Tax=Tetranychus urticae TaxID=32264 RepID=T1JVZ9_TETUR